MNRPLRRHAAAWALLLAVLPTVAWATGPKCGEACSRPAIELPVVPRGHLEPDATTQIAAPIDAFSQLANVRYRRLTVRDCQCLAVANAPLADALARERQALDHAHRCCQHPFMHCILPCHCDDRANKLRQCILYYAELEIRNRSAGAALDLFFRIVEAEVKDDMLALGREGIAATHGQAKDLADQGFQIPIELASLKRQELEANIDQARLRGGLLELNGKLKGLIGQGDLPLEEHLWPDGDFTVSYLPIDVEEAIQIALEQRAELRLLRTLNCYLDAKTLPVIREFLKTLNPGLGAQAKSNSPIWRLCEDLKAIVMRFAAERALRSGQLDELITEREQAVANEVRQAAAQVLVHAQLVDLDRQRVQSWADRVQELTNRLAQGEATFLDVLQAKLDWYKARASFAADVMGWHRAKAQLRLAQGVLVTECGATSR